MHEELNRASGAASDPWSFSILTYAWVALMAMWGGIVRVMQEHKLAEKTWKQIIVIVVSEMVMSCFVGVLTFWMCELAEFKPLYTAVLTSIGGYMGGKSLAIMRDMYKGAMSGLRGGGK